MNHPPLNPDGIEDAADLIWMLANGEHGVCQADRERGSYRNAMNVATKAVSAYLAAAHLDVEGLARVIMHTRLPYGGAGEYVKLDANAAYAVIELLKTHLAAQPVVNSVEQLKALPIGSVILDGGGDAGIIEPGAILFTETNPLSPEYVAKHYLPARVLYRPEVKP